MTTETLRQRAERYMNTECISRGEWCALVTALLSESDRDALHAIRDAIAEDRLRARGDEMGY